MTRNGVPFNIAGYKFYFTVKNSAEDADADAVIFKDWTDHFDPTTGKTMLSLTGSETAALKTGGFYFDIQYKSATNTVVTPAIGTLSVVGDITIRSN